MESRIVPFLRISRREHNSSIQANGETPRATSSDLDIWDLTRMRFQVVIRVDFEARRVQYINDDCESFHKIQVLTKLAHWDNHTLYRVS